MLQVGLRVKRLPLILSAPWASTARSLLPIALACTLAGCAAVASPGAIAQAPTPIIIYLTPPPTLSGSEPQASTPTPTPLIVYITRAPTLKPTPRPTPKPTLKPIVHVTKTVKLTLVESYNTGDPWYAFETGDWVTVWCPAGYKVVSGSYDFVYPTWQSVTGSRSTSKSGKQGWEFAVEIGFDTGNAGTIRGHLSARCMN